jgi:acetolactate decarboxylase
MSLRTIKKLSYSFSLVLLFGIISSCCLHSSENKDVIFQTSTINALMNGFYEGRVTFKDLKRHGDFGLGTFNSLEGEMIGLNGAFYQIKADGVAYHVDDSMKTPFAIVKFFHPDKTLYPDKSFDYKQLTEYLDSLLPTGNIFYAFKIRGVFSYIKARSVPGQSKPFPPLSVAVKNQTIFKFYNIKGTIIGFRFPRYMNGVNLPAYHFHFITEDRTAGGHLLECRTQNVSIEIDNADEFYMTLPKSKDFYDMNLNEQKREGVE